MGVLIGREAVGRKNKCYHELKSWKFILYSKLANELKHKA
jgi:hypothetical protein